MNIRQRISELVIKHGSLRAVARKTDIDVGYLSHLWVGTNTNPSNGICKDLGLKKRMVIEYSLIEEG